MTSAAANSYEPVVVVANPEDDVTAATFEVWLDRRADHEPTNPSATAAATLAEARSAGEA